MTQLPREKPALFKGSHFNHLLIIQAVPWYVICKLNYRDVCDLMAERGVTKDSSTVWALSRNAHRFGVQASPETPHSATRQT
jgi:transposase-like protein